MIVIHIAVFITTANIVYVNLKKIYGKRQQLWMFKLSVYLRVKSI